MILIRNYLFAKSLSQYRHGSGGMAVHITGKLLKINVDGFCERWYLYQVLLGLITLKRNFSESSLKVVCFFVVTMKRILTNDLEPLYTLYILNTTRWLYKLVSSKTDIQTQWPLARHNQVLNSCAALNSINAGRCTLAMISP